MIYDRLRVEKNIKNLGCGNLNLQPQNVIIKKCSKNRFKKYQNWNTSDVGSCIVEQKKFYNCLKHKNPNRYNFNKLPWHASHFMAGHVKGSVHVRLCTFFTVSCWFDCYRNFKPFYEGIYEGIQFQALGLHIRYICVMKGKIDFKV